MSTSDKSSSRKQHDGPSPALQFLLAAEAAMPRSLNKEARSKALNNLMRVAIDCRMAFGRGEGPNLTRLTFTSCSGVFRPLDEQWYTRASCAGGTYASLWEAHHRHQPWIAPDVFIGRDFVDQTRNSRVAPNMALLLRESGDDDPDRPVVGGSFEVWWCTSIDRIADTITLCRYRLPPDRRHPLTRIGQPRRRSHFDRTAWAELLSGEQKVAA